MAARNGKCFHTVERHGKGIAHANHLPTVWGQCPRSEEHTSELQSQSNFVCRLLLEKKNMALSSAPIYGSCSSKSRIDRKRFSAVFSTDTARRGPTTYRSPRRRHARIMG